MFGKSALVVLLVAALAIVALGAPSNSAHEREENKLKCYSCKTNKGDPEKCKNVVDEETHTEECEHGCYEVSSENGEKCTRGCLEKAEDTCATLFPDLWEEDECITCEGDKCNNKHSAPVNPPPKLKCYSCETNKDDTENCINAVDGKTHIDVCAHGCYAASCKGGDLWSRGCLDTADDTCEAHEPLPGEGCLCETCYKSKCNSLQHNPSLELTCYSCTTENDGENCKVVGTATDTINCGTKCYAASSKDGVKWARGCLETNEETCETLLTKLGDKDTCELCPHDYCNDMKHSPPREEITCCNNNIFIALQQNNQLQ